MLYYTTQLLGTYGQHISRPGPGLGLIILPHSFQQLWKNQVTAAWNAHKRGIASSGICSCTCLWLQWLLCMTEVLNWLITLLIPQIRQPL